MTKAILVCFHKYQPYGGNYYEPILDFFLSKMKEYQDEYDKIYLIDSNWNIVPQKTQGMKVEIVRVNPHLRYYDAYKEVLPKVQEDAVLLLDNDMVIYRKGIIADAFKKLEEGYDVVTIFDTIGTITTEINEKWYSIMKGKSKFCPYFFGCLTEVLLKYKEVDWGSHMPEYETLGMLTYRMLEDGARPFEMPEDKADIMMEDSLILRRPLEAGKRGYYHIRSGSLPAVLFAYRQHDSEKFWDYIRHQPKREYLRQLAWYFYMLGASPSDITLTDILKDMEVKDEDWERYVGQFYTYHAL